jgi:alpha-L-fucosidase
MKKSILFGLLILLITSSLNAQQKINQQERMKWWTDAKFGLFLHWGLYSVTAGDWNGKKAKGNEHFMLYERIPLKEYAKIAERFNPIKFNADEWARYAKDAGMKYIVITAKHHEGFAMFDSPSNDYNIVKTTPFHKDPMKDLAVACQKYGLKLCFYYSLGRDWQDPDVPTNWPVKAGRSNSWDYPNEDAKDFSKYFDRKVKPQVRELLTQYGPIGIMWFDTPEQIITKSQSAELQELIRKLQPNCIINSRIGNGYGDYLVSEQSLTKGQDAKSWEACVTMSGKWGYNHYDTTWKSPELLVRQLVEVVSKGGNLLLNIGPMGNGEFPEKSISNLASIGKWMKINNEAIYGVHQWKIIKEGDITETNNKEKEDNSPLTMKDNANDATSKLIHPDIYFTEKNKDIYIFACSWSESQVIVKSLASGSLTVKKIVLLGSGEKIKWTQGSDHLIINMPVSLSSTLPVYVFKVSI